MGSGSHVIGALLPSISSTSKLLLITGCLDAADRFSTGALAPGHFRRALENMDKRKPVGRTVAELRTLFELLPEARFCFDIGHARQVDPTMTEATFMLKNFGNRLAEVHISEVNTASRHDPISRNARLAFQKVAGYIPQEIPIILEPLIDEGQSRVDVELESARQALCVESLVAA